MDKLKMHSLNGVERNIELIGKLFPNAITEVMRDGKVEHAIDFDVLRQELSDSIVEGREERYQFTWPDKKKAMLAANAPITATLRPVAADSVGKDGTSGGFDSENLYIEGDNLEVLKLLQETYLGKVKMIYIDPPYNTGNDFVYEDDFAQSAAEYMDNSGQYDEEGNRLVTNTESNGRFHTDWLNMIYPRLRLAKDLLADDGAVFISLDDNEIKNLLKICDEVFGEDNFVDCITWNKRVPKNDNNGIGNIHEYIVVYVYLDATDVHDVHKGYFSIDKKGHSVNSSVKRGTDMSDDISVYDLILKNKERLLSFEEPTRFIFSHSALREGWDNPNVFQICTLKHSDSTTQKRQEVGRGLRLCVNKDGNRMDAEILGEKVQDINVLTVIASESYAGFVDGLQKQTEAVLYDRPRKADIDYFVGKAIKLDGKTIKVDDRQARAMSGAVWV